MKRTISLVLLALLAAGCERDVSAPASAETKREPAAVNAPADNTDKNERDQHVAALTPGDQGGSEADRTVTQKVRQGVVDIEGLSVNGKNVKIITQDGVVTLRGPVKTDKEKADIAAIAKSVAGVKSVDNQLEVATN
jgi:osmotically-inducible protein OsmY